jgi:hypothetical protein
MPQITVQNIQDFLNLTSRSYSAGARQRNVSLVPVRADNQRVFAYGYAVIAA